MMKTQHFTIFLTLSFIVSFSSQPRITIGGAGTAGPVIQDLIGEGNLRRILHQPLFPESSSPPPASLPPPPPPPAPVAPEFPNPDQPFFPEVPGGPTPDQAQQAPPVPANGTAVPNPVATPAQQTTPAKKVAIAISVGIVTLGMLSALAFYLYKHRAKHPDESQKLVPTNSQRVNEESRMPPSTFLYIGTVEPSTQITVTETNDANASPYRKLNSIKRSERYRPSPDLQPLPPLTKPPPPPAINSPPPMSSSDEESRDTSFYTPQGSSVSNEEGYYTPSSRLSQQSYSTSLVTQSKAETHVNTSVPHSKRTSPKSRLYASSSPDVRHAIIPSIKQPPAPPLPSPPQPTDSPELSGHQSQVKPSKPAILYTPKRPKFSSPPPPPDINRLQQISNQGQETTKPPLPPPPPPLPPSLTTPRKAGASEMSIPSTASRKLIMPKSMSPSPKTTAIEKTGSPEEFNNGTDSSERHNGDDLEGLKPKLKPLHWDKVRATSDRATVWDQLKSSSFQ